MPWITLSVKFATKGYSISPDVPDEILASSNDAMFSRCQVEQHGVPVIFSNAVEISLTSPFSFMSVSLRD